MRIDMAKKEKLSNEEKTALSSAIGYSRERGKVFRENRLKLMREAVGHNYSDNGAIDKVPINLMELALNIYLQRLVAQNPKVAISTFYPQLKEIVTRFEIAGNRLIEEINLGKTLETAVSAAMFSKGIVKIYLNRSKVEVGGVYHDSGQVAVDAISLDDWFEDMTVEKNENGQFEGNYWYCTIDEALEMFPDTKEDDFTYREEQTNANDKDHQISEGETSDRREFKRTVKMMDIFLKKQNLIVQAVASTADQDDYQDPIGKILRVFEWKGPENGPYRKLGFAELEGNTMPVAPAMHWYDMHDLSNRLFRKLGRQAERQKTVVGVRPGADRDGNATLDASDGDMIKLDDPKNISEFKTGGIDQATLAYVLVLKDLFSYFAGNLDMLGGLGAQSETLGQDQLLSASASMRIQKMQKEVTTFTTEVLQDLMWYLWYDPNPNQQDIIKTVPGFESIAIAVPFKPDDREGDYLQYNIKMEPYSMQHQSPESKMQGIRTILLEMVGPLTPFMQQQGVTLNIEKLFKTVAKLSNISELNDIIEYATPTLNDSPIGHSSEIRQPANTTRTNIRRNVPGRTNQGQSQVLQQALLGGKPQQSEVATLTG
jgi:hypothetical protein